MKRRLLIFTDLDGTLMHPTTYAYEAALPTIRTLTQQGHGVIPVTSKTRKEVERLIQDMGDVAAFVVENGSAVFVPPSSPLFHRVELPLWGNSKVYLLGILRKEARQALRKIQKELGRESLRSLDEMDDEEVMRLTNLPASKISAMRVREFSEPFVLIRSHLEGEILRLAERMGFRILQGDRFYHIIGARAGKGEAMGYVYDTFKQLYPDIHWVVGALGNAPNDLEMLTRADLAVVIGEHPQLQGKGFHHIRRLPPEGWVEGVQWMLGRLEQTAFHREEYSK